MAERQNPLLAATFIEQMVWPVLRRILAKTPHINAREFRAVYESETNTAVPPAVWSAWLTHLGLRPTRRTFWETDPNNPVTAEIRVWSKAVPPRASPPVLSIASEEPPRVQRAAIMEDASMMTGEEQALARQTFGPTTAVGYVEPPTDGFKFDNE